MGVFKELTGKYARVFREDFCGTFALSAAWVKRNRQNQAIAIDLDPEPIAYGKKSHLKPLTADQKKRISIHRDNVITFKGPRVDLILVGNFSFYVFKKRDVLVEYLRACHRSLKPGGVMMLEMAGGPGMIEQTKERKVVRPRKNFSYTYIWDQKSFDPITHDAKYAIHFRFDDGSWMRDAFTYDWRLWTIPEVRDCLREAGFKDTCVYWETEVDGEPSGEYTKMEHGDNAYSWIAHVVGIR